MSPRLGLKSRCVLAMATAGPCRAVAGGGSGAGLTPVMGEAVRARRTTMRPTLSLRPCFCIWMQSQATTPNLACCLQVDKTQGVETAHQSASGACSLSFKRLLNESSDSAGVYPIRLIDVILCSTESYRMLDSGLTSIITNSEWTIQSGGAQDELM